VILLLFLVQLSSHAQVPAPLPIGLPSHTPDVQDHFVKNKKPLAKHQDVLLTQQFFKHLMSIPWYVINCARALMKGETFSQLTEEPYRFELFNILHDRNHQHGFNLNFANHGDEINTVCPNKHGVCQGLTNLDRRMNMLAYYDPKNILMAKIPSKTQPKEKFKFYEERVNLIRKGKPAIIPGFEDLLEFSSDPIGAKVLQEAVVKTWASENATISVVTQVLSAAHGNVADTEGVNLGVGTAELYKKLKARLSLHYNPIVYLTVGLPVNDGKWIHVMQVLDVAPVGTDGSFKITFKDPNMQIDWRKQTLDVDAKGHAEYLGLPIGKIDLMPGDDMEIAQFLINTQKFCLRYPIFCIEGGKID